VLFARRSETVNHGPPHERLATIDLTATAAAGMAVIVAILVAFIVDLANGGDGMPYAWLGAIGGVAYVVAVIVPACAAEFPPRTAAPRPTCRFVPETRLYPVPRCRR
jgi:hypothetical protein